MNTYEILDDTGAVVNTIIADENFVMSEYPNRYRLVPPPPPLPVYVPAIITKLAMITRFTDSEYVGVLAAAKTDVEVQAWVDKLYAATNIDLKDLRTIAGINMLVIKNLLTQDRATEILNLVVQPGEEP